MRILYTLFIYIYLIGIRIASLYNPKAKLWISGRKSIFNIIQSSIINHQSPIIWFHCASLGEFEQARPLIERIKNQKSPTKIVLTFFSPSGYEIRKSYPFADYVFYLPIDTPSNASRFIKLINPAKVFFVKYEFWFNYLNELKNKNIPTYLVSGIFRKSHYFSKSYSVWFRKQLKSFTHFFVQDELSAELLNSIGYNNVTISGDTRFDRVNEIANNLKSFPLIEQFKSNMKLFIAGSTWEEDEKIISQFNFNNTEWKIVIAPHQVNESHINSIVRLFSNKAIIKYSDANKTNIINANILVIDNIGMLSTLYQYGTIAFIGGGFGKGIHNILEAATFGLPVIFGHNYRKFNEAVELINLGGAFDISDIKSFERILVLMENEANIKNASDIAKNYVQTRIGATEMIFKSVF